MRTVLLLALLAGSALGQTVSQVGHKDLPIQNPTSRGSRVLQSRVFYPATRSGRDAPLRTRTGGWPSLVFLHGYNQIGSVYFGLGLQLALSGYIAVMSDTARADVKLQREDGIALYSALAAENRRKGAFLEGALDMSQVGVLGHSMGGGNTIGVLAENPGYRAGACLAPWVDPVAAARVKTPFVIIVGTGDQILPWKTHSLGTFDAAKSYTGVKLLYVMNNDCDHLNIAVWELSGQSQTDREVFERTLSVMKGFFDRFVKGDPGGLDAAVGPSARAEKRLHAFQLEVETPDYFKTGPEAIGRTTSFHVVGDRGLAAHLMALRRSRLDTPFGTLLLDPATLFVALVGSLSRDGIFTLDVPVPGNALFKGLVLPFQGLGHGEGRLRLTDVVELRTGK